LSTTANTNSPVAGSPYPITIARGTLSAANYSFTFVDGTLTVSQAELIARAEDQSRVYGTTNPVFTINYSGFVNGETAVVVDVPPVASTLAETNSPIGTYTITLSGGSDDNYSLTLSNGTLTVTAAALTITADDQSKIYGQANPAFTVRYSGFVDGQDSNALSGTLVVNTPAASSSPAGAYPIHASGLSSTNYTISFVDGTLKVNKAPLTASADNQSRVYGLANSALTISYSGFVNGDTASAIDLPPVANTTATATSNAGTYPITLSSGNDDNYALTLVDGTLTVTKAPLTARADNQSRGYGQANPALTISYSGFVNADTAATIDVPPVASTTATATSTAGTYPITLSGGSDDNYALTLVDGTLTVTAAPPPTITGQPQNQTVNLGGTAQFNVTATGPGILIYQWLFNDNPIAGATTTSLVISNAQPSNAGTYSVVVDNGSQTTSTGAVLKVNQPPTLATIPNQTVNELTTMTVAVSATDPEAGPLTYQLTQAPAGAAINASGVVSWTPTEAQGPSTNTFTVQVADNGTPPLTDSKSFTVVVNEVNSAPVLTVPAPQTVRVGATMTITNTALDADIPANLLTFSLVSAPTGMVINSTTGVITWTPPVSQQSSTNIVTVRVTDSGQPPLSDTRSFTVTAVGVGQRVTAIQPANGAMVLTLEGIPGETYHIEASPNLNPPISWSVIGTNTAGIDGLSQFIDTDVSLYPIRFYRSVKP